MFSLDLPEDFGDYEWEVTAKGCFLEARLVVSGIRYRLNFFDASRLTQEIVDELENGNAFFEANLVVVHSVTRQSMERAVEQLVQSGRVTLLMREATQ